MSSSRMRRVVLAIAVGMACPALLSCSGSAAKPASRPGAAEAPASEGTDAECCCQRYDETGRPTGAAMSDSTACKSTGGNCLDSRDPCEEE